MNSKSQDSVFADKENTVVSDLDIYFIYSSMDWPLMTSSYDGGWSSFGSMISSGI